MRWTRRGALKAGVTLGLAGLAGCSGPLAGDTDDEPAQGGDPDSAAGTATETTPTVTPVDQSELDPVDVRGALYLPARAFNTYQMWANYDPAVVERDLGYAERLDLNAIRTWLNYEFWLEEPETHAKRVEHFLSAAADRDIRVLFGLFDFVGKQPTEENLHDTDPMTATATQSPSMAVAEDRSRWDDPREFVRWFVGDYRDDDRLLGIEAMNEPGWQEATKRFTRGMFETMTEERGSVPLTIGSTSMSNNTDYYEWGSEILQFHYNFPADRGALRDALRQVNVVASRLDAPVWFTEWQRVRDGRGFASAPPPDQRGPNYSSMAPLIHEAGFGNFFWSLMVKPAYVPSQRKNGILNGLFHEDGAVWSLDDARAIKAMSGDASFDGEERRRWPEWAREVKRRATS